MVPFSRELPPIPSEALGRPLVFYGQTSLVLAAHASPHRRGVFFDPESFRPSVYLERLGGLMLNDDASPTTIAGLAASPRADDDRVFVRPDDDLKGFSGQVMTMAELRAWRETIGEHADGDVAAGTRIVVAAPKEIGREYRAVVAGGRIASLDAADGRGTVPAAATRLVEDAVARWAPAPAFALDVAEAESGLKVIELNCFNASGLYAEDATEIVRAVSRVAASVGEGQ